MRDQESTVIRSAQHYNYCPLCGQATTTEKFPISKYKYNVEVKCPKHGTLIHR